MTSSAAAPPPIRSHLPWATTGAALIAFGALYLTQGQSLLMPFLGLALLASYFTEARLENRFFTVWMLRAAFYAVLFALYAGQPAHEPDALVDSRALTLVAEGFAVEIVLRAWMRDQSTHPTLFTCPIILAACNTYELPNVYPYIRYFTPLYTLFLALALRAYRPRLKSPSAGSARWLVPFFLWMTLLLAVSLGTATHYVFYTYRTEITDLGMRFLNEHPPSRHTTGLSTSPFLGATFGDPGTLDRVLRLEHYAGDSHLRAMAFDTYTGGMWYPHMDQRHFAAVATAALQPDAAGAQAHITRLEAADPYLFAPLNATGLRPATGSDLEWDREEGGPLQVGANDPDTYMVITTPDDTAQGPLCTPPDSAYRARCLAVADTIDPRVRQLARQITAGQTDPRARIQAVQTYLLTHHKYSLTAQPGPGDPLSDFLLQRRAAHCEYFAAAATMLLRYAGVPSRYVIGYYAHEEEEPGITIVRQRDAHAWAESWVDGLGWVTVDATPGDGRPDHTAGPLPLWIKIKEWFEDRIAALRESLAALAGGPALALAVGSLILLVLALRWWLRRSRLRQAASQGVAYVNIDRELAALAARFDLWLQRQGLPCPPGRPWREHLAALEAAGSTGTPRPALRAAAAFANVYTAVRFGRPDDRAAIRQIQTDLQNLESAAKIYPSQEQP